MPPGSIRGFRGLTNTVDPIQLKATDLVRADDVLVTPQGQLERFPGFTLRRALTNEAGTFVSRDRQRLYVIENGSLLRLDDALGAGAVLRTGLSVARPYHSCEVNGDIFYTNGVDRGRITSAGEARPWGSPVPPAPGVSAAGGSLRAGRYSVVCTFVDAWGLESGNSEAIELEGSGGVMVTVPALAGYTTNVYVNANTVFYLAAENAVGAVAINTPAQFGRELEFLSASEPRGELPAVFNGQVYCAESFPTVDLSVLWESRPLLYHHFDVDRGVAYNGIARMLVATEDALIFGTDREIRAWNGERWSLLADYGVIAGHHACVLDGRVYFWTERGLCRAMPFANITESRLSVAPGLLAGGAVIEQAGMTRYVLGLQQGGAAYNDRDALPLPDPVRGTCS